MFEVFGFCFLAGAGTSLGLLFGAGVVAVTIKACVDRGWLE